MKMTQNKSLGWELEKDIDWKSLDTSKPLLPLEPLGVERFSLDKNQKLVLSQFLGLMAIRAIAQHEEILGVIRSQCTQRLNASAELTRFFEEEAKHSAAFDKYVETFAKIQGIRIDSLKKILPRFSKHSWLTKIFLLNNAFKGDAIWQLVHITELESIDLYRFLRDSGMDLEPVFRELNRLHYEEEIGHISIPPMVLNSLRGSGKRTSSWFPRVLHALWGISQFRHLWHLKALRQEHVFFCDLDEVCKKISVIEMSGLFKAIYLYVISGKRIRLKESL